MAFTNRLLLIVPGFGTPIQNDALFLKVGTVLGAITSTSTSMTGLTPAIKSGWVRLRLYGSAGAGTVTSVGIALTDGTTTEIVYSTTFAAAASTQLSTNSQVCISAPFLTELAATQVNVITVLGTAVCTLDIEVGASN